MTKPVPQDMQDVIEEVSTTTSGRGDLANEYKILDTIIEDSLKDVAYNSTVDAFKTTITDNYSFNAEISPIGEIRTADKYRLCGGIFAGTTLDTNFASFSSTGSASATILNRLLTISTGTTANSTGRIETVHTGQYTASNSNIGRFNIALGDTGTVNNIRRWGITTTTNGFFFYLNGTEFGIGRRKDSIETLTPLSNYTLDTNLHTYEIYYTTIKVYFIIDGVLKHSISSNNVPLIADYNLKPAISNNNYNNSITDVKIHATSVTLSRLGPLITNPIYKNLVGAGTYVLKQSAGRLHSVICNNAAQTTGQSITIYDNTSATGNKIGTLDLSKLPSPMAIQYNSFGVAFSTGLTLVIAGSAVDITVIYE